MSRQTGLGEGRAALGEGEPASGADAGIEVVLVPVRPAPPTAPTASGTGRPAAADPEPDASPDEEEGENGTGEGSAKNGTPGEDTGPAGEDNEQGDEAVDQAQDALAVAAAFAAAPPAGITAVLPAGEPAPDRPAARARGAAAARGEHLLFLEGSDALTGYALSYLLNTARDTRSDLVVGNVYTFDELGAAPSKRHRRHYARARLAEDPRNVPGLVADGDPGNKLWRRDFWNSLTDHGLHPDDAGLGLRRAALSARTVDVLPGPTLLKRRRAQEALPLDEDVLTRRLGAMTRLAEGLATHDRDLWDRTLLNGELHRLLMRLDDADEETRATAVALVNTYLDHVPARLLDGLGVLDRLLYHLVRKHRAEDVVEVATFAKSVEIKKATLVRRGFGYYIRYPFFEAEDPAKAVPREVYRVDEDIKVRQKTEEIAWEDGRLHIRGRLGIRHLRAHRRWHQHVTAYAVRSDDRRRVRLPVRIRRAAEYRLPDVLDAARHDYGGFTVIVDPRRLRESGRWDASDWKIELVVLNRGITRRRALSNPVPGPAKRPGYHRVDEQVWVRPHWNRDQHLIVSVEPCQAMITGHRFDERTGVLELTGAPVAAPAAEAVELRLTRRPGTATVSVPLEAGGGRFTARVAARELFDRTVEECNGVIRQETWDAHLVTREKQVVPLVVPEEVAPAAYADGDGRRELSVLRSAVGHLRLRAGLARPSVEEARWEGRTLLLSGAFRAAAELGLVAKARGRDEEHVLEVERSGERFTARFSPADVPTLSGTLSLPAGGYQLWGRVGSSEEGAQPGAGSSGPGSVPEEARADVGVEFAEELLAALPLEMQTAERGYTLSYQGRGIPVLQVGSDLRPVEQGTFAQRELRETFYPARRLEPVVDGVLFDTYTGRQYSDSPQSIYAELRRRERWADHPMSWLVADGQVSLPEDLTRVRHRGREYYEGLARSRYLVTNSRQPAWFHRHPDQTVVQTWHGSMLKRIGFDVENIRGKSRDYFDKLAWETRQWDYLVSPSPWATPILRSAFRFEGEVLETGYPRNDVFFAPDRDAIAERTRERLGLPADKKVVLYAPTWRDDKYYTRGKHKLDLHLDLQRLYDELGKDHVLLVRRHPRVVDAVPIVGRDFVYDVSLYPEIMELFLVTDVLITDYSSMMFDFANTGRPMLFFTYDLEGYRDNLRGFYFDFEETAPGPLLMESDQVIEALRGIDDVVRESAGAYRAFVEQFCPLDDGGAARRVVDRVFGTD
ncbi:CDP-glycerol glycerophosphotransferase family protein [Nocardiopsis protaetiae]|uniref:CDP-glycerol glycerophosphotransferase family protein n=1 Tax=Nocardiopsis protaetiae TaxID=3382270 RepID=UPI00387B36A3